MNKNHLTGLAIILIIVVGTMLYINNPEPIEYKNPKNEEVVACTADAKLCPDGSYVGRVGPNCEFARCLDTKKDIEGPVSTSTETEGTEVETSTLE